MSADAAKKVTFTLDQGAAIEPTGNFWVSASAGTGKTQVLTARVLRLLLEEEVRPENILCVTYTKAGAAEMAQRIFKTLASWVALPDADLFGALHGGLNVTDARQKMARARTLFARVLEARGGLKIQTLHSFCQSLLTRFPLEAGIAPGFSTLEEQRETELQAQALDSEIVRAFAVQDKGFLADIDYLAVRATDEGLRKMLRELIAAFAKPGQFMPTRRESFRPHVRRLLGLPTEGDAESWLVAHIRSKSVDMARLQHVCRIWGKGMVTNQKLAASLQRWLDQPTAKNIDALAEAFLTQAGTPRSDKSLGDADAQKFDPAIKETALAAQQEVVALVETVRKFGIAELAATALRVSWLVLQTVTQTKDALGLVSFNDLIGKVAELLTSGAGDWVRYRLDDQITHVLVDEAQDTNAAQWQILSALTEEYFAGRGAQPKHRSIFVVGDFKQSIFRFQGADPQTFIAEERRLEARVKSSDEHFEGLPLKVSFRSAPAIIDFVNAAIPALGPDQLGAGAAFDLHEANRAGHGGQVTLWPLTPADKTGIDEDDLHAELERPWEDKAERVTAQRIARQIHAWLDPHAPHHIGGQPVRPADIMVLVQSRGLLAPSLVSNLKALGVPVAGADRMILGKQIVVQDLLSAARFALQPEDDLTLACLLKSPFFNFDEKQLYALAFGREKQSLWSRLRDDPLLADCAARLNHLLMLADAAQPFDFLSTLLEQKILGRATGRAQLLARLGSDVDEPIVMLLEAALAFERDHAPSLQAFVSWMESDDTEVKRDPDAPRNEVRVLTVHGAKGLEAKIVILADSHRPPKMPKNFTTIGDGASALPILYGNKENAIGEVADALMTAEAEIFRDYWRLFYVAITRPRDALYLTGWEMGTKKSDAVVTENPAKAKKEPVLTWHRVAANVLGDLNAEQAPHEIWEESLSFTLSRTVDADKPPAPAAAPVAAAVPAWALMPAPPEPIPPRPLTPSQLGGEDMLVADPPLARNLLARARGTALHRLLELLPEVDQARRPALGARLLAQTDLPAQEHDGMIAQVLAVLSDPAFTAVFGQGSLAEVPVTAVLGSAVLSGQIDRLAVTATQVLIVDYKTSAAPPETPDRVPLAHLRQMAAYTHALRQIYPGREIVAALLWTATPRLMPLPPGILADAAASFALA